jgi:hypothetical protein
MGAIGGNPEHAVGRVFETPPESSGQIRGRLNGRLRHP